MPFSISEILSQINGQGGLLSPAHFLVRITPKSTLSGLSESVRTIPFFCDTASLPGLSLQIQGISRYGYGIQEKRPIRTTFADWPSTFFCDGSGDIQRFFENWMLNITNFDMSNLSGTKNGLRPFDYRYPDDYESTIEVIHYDPTGEIVNTYVLHQAFPVSLGEVQVDWSMQDSIMKLPVTFAYTYWTSDNTKEVNAVRTVDSLNYTMLRTGAAGVNGLRLPNLIQETVNVLNNNKIFV